MTNSRNTICFWSVVLLLSNVATAAMEFQRQTIAIPDVEGWWVCHLADVDGDGRMDLLALLPARNEMLVYRQRPSGFPATPDQTVTLPPETAWVAVRDIDTAAGQELVISTATGLAYFRQKDGVFEPELHPLVEARQVFTGEHLRIVPTAPGAQDANNTLPILLEDRAALYEKGADGAWHAGKTVDLSSTQATWRASEEHWMTGPTPAFTLEVYTAVRASSRRSGPATSQDEKKTAQELVAKIVKDAQWRQYEVRYQDVDGDGREDVVVWTTHGELNPRVTILLLLRGPDGKLPARPTQVLRHYGWPITVERKLDFSPFWDLDGDGRCELILATLRSRLTSWSSVMNMVASGSVDWALTVRSGRNGVYADNPDFQVDFTTLASQTATLASVVCLDGDFNGDGRVDLLVKRGPQQYDVYFSSSGPEYFQPGPALSLSAPTEADRIDTTDLNRDGISDLFIQDLKEAKITVCLSPSNQQKGPPK